MSEQLLTVAQVAEILQMSENWVRDHASRREPRIPAVRMGARRARLRFRVQDVQKFQTDNLVGYTEEPA